MIDSVQLILLLVILTLTVLFVILGVQVFYILHDLRLTIKKTNKILENADEITEGIQGPVTAISSFLLGTKATSLLSIVGFVKNLLGRDDGEKKSKRE